MAWQRMARQAWQGGAMMCAAGKARRGNARRGNDVRGRQGKAWRGAARYGTVMQAWLGMVWRGVAMQGKAGKAWHGEARQNDDGERPVAARKDGLHLNNAERHNKESEE